MRVGIGTEDITPSIGMRTELFQNLLVDAIITPLLLKVCILECEGTAMVIVAADVMDFFADSIDDIRNIIHDVAGIQQQNIFINSSHTHSAPYIYPSAQRYLDKRGTGFLDMEYYKGLLNAARAATAKAVQNLEDAEVKYSSGFVSAVASNRRVELEDGSVGVRYGRDVPENLRERPDGLIDPHVECIWFHRHDGTLIGALINYACHGTSYNQYSEICWDYMGFARENIEKQLGGQVLFLQGCAGNISPGKYTTHEPLDDAMLLGKRLSDAALQGYSHLSGIHADFLKVISKEIHLKGRTTLGAEELQSKLEREVQKALSACREGKSEPSGAMVISYLERLLMLRNYPDLNIPSEIGIVYIGKAALVFLPGECFIQYALKIKKHMAGKPVLVMSYADCTLQYIPDRKAYDEAGGYETDPDWCYSEMGNGERLVQEVISMFEENA